MGFSGWYQILCKNRHAGGADCYDSPNFDGDDELDQPLWNCGICGEIAAWWNLVDVTNGSYYEGERIDGYIELEIATIPSECKCECRHTHSKGGTFETYKLPEGGHIVK